MKCMKSLRSHLLLHVLSLFLSCIVFISSTLGIKAEEITPTPTPSSTSSMTLSEFMDRYGATFYELESYWARGLASFPDAYGGGTGIAFGNFADYLEEKSKGYLLTEDTITVDSNVSVSGGRGFTASEELRQEVVNFVNDTYIAENPLPYKEAYIPSYNFLSPTLFPSYAMYTAVKESMKSVEGYHVINNIYRNAYTWTTITYFNMSHSLNLGWVGTVTEGAFVSVYPYVNWQVVSGSYPSPWFQRYSFNTDGSVNNSVNATVENNKSYSNNNLDNQSLPKYPVFTSNDKNELVFVFTSLNAYKNYNSGLPQNYYLPTGSTTDVPFSDPFSLEDLSNASGYYNSIVDNSVTGMTGQEVIDLVDLILKNTDGGSGSGTGIDNTGLWKGIGEAIGSLITGIATVVSEVASALSNAILSIINIFVGENGLFSKLAELVNTNFSGFLTSVFGWLPPEIVTLFTATLVFGIFFAIWKMLRG